MQWCYSEVADSITRIMRGPLPGFGLLHMALPVTVLGLDRVLYSPGKFAP